MRSSVWGYSYSGINGKYLVKCFLQNMAKTRYMVACSDINIMLQKSLMSSVLQKNFAGFGPNPVTCSVWARSPSSRSN